MLAIDDVKKLAKMQEVLLSRTSNDRAVNLNKYKEAIRQIDDYDFSNLLSEVDKINNHNQTLEEELQFLEQIKDIYEQILEQQLNFKRICELYGDDKLQLSDLSQLNIEYIENRISVISGYLINQKNIGDTKKRLVELNERLVSEEKNNDILGKKLLEFEERLRDNFINAEGRMIVAGKLQYMNVISEYKELGYDFKQLLYDEDEIENLLSLVSIEMTDTEEKLKTAEICYNRMPNFDSKQIYDEIDKEYLKVKYKLAMLKILDLVSKDYSNYDLFKRKREDILDLIKYRFGCLTKLGFTISIDPFNNTKVFEQLDMISSLRDSSNNISKLKKEIVVLNQRLEELMLANDTYMISINSISDLIIHNRIEKNDENIYLNTSYEDSEPRTFLGNQVVSIRNVPMKFNNGIVKQKTRRVITRVYEMFNNNSKNLEKEVLTPELVIVQDFDSILTSSNLQSEEIDTSSVNIDNKIDVEGNNDNNMIKISEVSDSDLFITVDPFLETPLFTDRIDDGGNEVVSVEEVKSDDVNIEVSETDNSIEIETDIGIDRKEDDDVEFEMPDAFWVTQEETNNYENNDSVEFSFDEQIDALLSNEEDMKIKKLAA